MVLLFFLLARASRRHIESCVTAYNEKALNPVQTWLPDFSAMCHYTKFGMVSITLYLCTFLKCEDGDPRSKQWQDRFVDQRDVIDSDLPVKIALSQETNDLGQIILIYIVDADCDVWYPISRIIVILDTRARPGNFLPECFMKLR